MKKKIAFLIITIVLVLIGVLGYSIYNRILEAEKVAERIAKLPISLVKIEDESVFLSETPDVGVQPIVITYFNTTCRFCQAEIRSFQQHAELLEKTKIILYSDEPQSVLDNFIKEFNIDTTKLAVKMDYEQKVRTYFDVLKVPTTFVYGVDSLLIGSYRGEVNADVIYALIN